MGILKPHSKRLLYSSMLIGTAGWAVTFGTARMGLDGLWLCPVPSSLYQM